MAGQADAHHGTSEIRPAHRFDVPRLESWLSRHLEGFSGPLTARQFSGGQSNPTYLLETPGRQYVLRRKPPGVLLASAHAVEREHRVISALAGAGFPVPRAYVLCEDPEVIGTAFYVMQRVEGRVLWDPALPELPKAERRGIHAAFIETLAQLHKLDVAALGLSDFGRPGNSFVRQIGRWSKQYQAEPEAGRLPDMDLLVEWLPTHVPPGDETALLHGDYRLDNVMFDKAGARVLAVIDWELSTLGHPLADFTYLLLMYHMPQSLMKTLTGLDPVALGVPTEREAVDIYCAAAGRRPLASLDFYHAYNLFRFAAICHGIRGRLLKGNASSEQAERYARSVEPLAELALQHARNAGLEA